MWILLMVHFTNSAAVKRAVEGFLSGFQNTEIYIKDSCLSEEWKDQIWENFEEFDEASVLEKIEKVYRGTRLVSNIKTDCHFAEIGEIFFYLAGRDSEDLVLLTFLNGRFLVEMGKTMIFKGDLFENSKNIGKLFRIWVNTENYVIGNGTGDMIYEVLKGISDDFEGECQKNTEEIREFLNSLGKNDYDKLKQALKQSTKTLKKIENCDFEKTLSTIRQLITWKTYIQIGMNLERFSTLYSELLSSFSSKNYSKMTEKISEMIEFLLPLES